MSVTKVNKLGYLPKWYNQPLLSTTTIRICYLLIVQENHWTHWISWSLTAVQLKLSFSSWIQLPYPTAAILSQPTAAKLWQQQLIAEAGLRQQQLFWPPSCPSRRQLAKSSCCTCRSCHPGPGWPAGSVSWPGAPTKSFSQVRIRELKTLRSYNIHI